MYRWCIIIVMSCIGYFFFDAQTQAEPLGQDTVTKVEARKTKAEKEAAIAAAQAEAEKNRDQFARVVVLRYPSTKSDYSADHTDLNLQRNVRSAIGKTDALFLPAVDIYQDGREIKDKTLPPELQPGSVGQSDIDYVRTVINQAKALKFSDVDSNEWLNKGLEYRKAGEKLWFIDRPELREPLFNLYGQIGRAAENLDNSTPPLFEYVGGQNVNYYYYLAASLAYQEPELLSKVKDADVQGGIQYYLELLQRGVFPSMKIDFQTDTAFDIKKFSTEYEVLINGLPVELDSNGELEVFLGRSDILLKRKDAGYGLSDRFEAVKTEEKAYRIMEIARKRMEVDFVKQLFFNKGECTPQLESDILNDLAIYAKMHPDVSSQIYIAVPEYGNPNKVWVWRFEPSTMTLNKVVDGQEEFPVHFVASMGMGALYNGATISFTTPDPTAVANGASAASFVNPSFSSANVPVAFDLRAHYTRFMVQTGIEFGMNLNNEGWTEYYQTPGLKNSKTDTNDFEDKDVVTVQVNADCLSLNKDDRREGEVSSCVIQQEIYHVAKFSQTKYLGVGYLFGRDAAFGYGLRLAGRLGFMNMPSSFVPTMHLGYTLPLDFYQVGDRVRPIVDLDVRGGTAIVRGRNLGYDLGETKFVEPIFGFTLTAGTTF